MKIAVHARAGEIHHFSRQLPDGRRASKLGSGVDVVHHLAEVESHYGQASWFFSRKP